MKDCTLGVIANYALQGDKLIAVMIVFAGEIDPACDA